MATRKYREKVRRIKINPYNYDVHIVFTTDQYEAAKRRGIKIVANNVRALHVSDGGLDSIIILPFDCGVQSVVHEAFHCVWAIMAAIGADHENEVMAYTLGYLVNEIWKFRVKQPYKVASSK